MDPAVIVSPHLDDAVLSCGQFMAGRPDCFVITVFTGAPPRTAGTTTYDRSCGFDTGVEAMRQRRREDAQALTVLGAGRGHLGFLDHQYRPHARPDPAELAAQLQALINGLDLVERILIPVGLGHPDHLLAAAAGRLLEGAPIYAYEELPYRVLYPEAVPAAMERHGIPWPAEPEFIGTGPADQKAAAVACYASQLWALDAAALACPERFWRLP